MTLPSRGTVALCAGVCCGLVLACDPGPPPPEVGESGALCDPDWSRSLPDSVVVVTGETAPCSLEFREITRLGGEVDGVAPREPVAVGPDSTFYTATFDPGEIAVWSWSGELLRTFGEGPGDGPGEFGLPRTILIDQDDIVTILTGSQLWHRYTTSGDFIESVRTPGPSGAGDADLLADGTVVTRLSASQSAILTFDGVRFDSLGPPPPVRTVGFVEVVGDRVWIADMRRYTVRAHDVQTGQVIATVVRDVEWYPDAADPTRSNSSSNLYGLSVTDSGLLFVQVGLDQPDPPAEPRGALTGNRADDIAIMSPYRDNLIEVIGLDGSLLASRRYDNVGDPPNPITPDLWYRVETDLLESITIFEPVLSGGG